MLESFYNKYFYNKFYSPRNSDKDNLTLFWKDDLTKATKCFIHACRINSFVEAKILYENYKSQIDIHAQED